jgi:anti-anti-sigma regulatory factor
MQKEPTMLRVETQESVDALIFRLEGRFTGEGAEHVRTLVARSDNEMRLVIDLTEVLFIDALGEAVLSFLKRLGAQFVAETSYSRDVCERLHLPLVCQG